MTYYDWLMLQLNRVILLCVFLEAKLSEHQLITVEVVLALPVIVQLSLNPGHPLFSHIL